MPLAQFEQTVAPDAEYLPPAQLRQLGDPVTSAKVPEAQGVHATDAVESANWPGKHGSHLDLPVLELNVPTEQNVQARSSPAWPWYVPAAQSVQLFILGAAYLPAAQGLHDPAPAAAYLPAPQPVHESVAEPEAPREVPWAQRAHVDWPGRD